MSKAPGSQTLFRFVLLRVVPVAAAVLVAIGYFAYDSVERTEYREVSEMLTLESNHALDLVLHPIATLKAEAEALAANDLMVNGLIDVENRDSYLEPFFKSVRVPGPEDVEVSLLDYRGRIIATNVPSRESDWDAPSWERVIATDRTTLTLTRDGFTVAAPVRYLNRPEGAILVHYGREKLIDLFEVAHYPLAVALTQADGQVLFSSNPDLVVAEGVLGDMEPGTWLASRRPLPGFDGIFLVTAKRTDEALATVREVRRIIIISLVGSILALICVAGMAALLATREVNRVVDLIRGIGSADDMHSRVAVQGPAEMQALGESFNAMLERLQKETTSRTYFDSIISSLSEILLVVSLDGKIRTANPAGKAFLDRVGMTDNAFVNVVFGSTDFGASDDPDAFLQWTTDVHMLEATYARPGGKTLTILWLKSILRDATGNPTGLIFVGQDVSERVRIERLKSEFISTVNHELRTPLTSIAGTLGLLKGGIAGEMPEKARNLINIGHSNCQRLINLINDLLDIQKIESGGMEFRMVPTDLVRLVESAIVHNEAFADQYGIRFAFETHTSQATVIADPDRLDQVMTNLLSNAAKFSPAGSLVRVAVFEGNTGPVISVADEGPGIPKDFRSRIFERFAQADSSDTRQKGGTGLGLAIVKAIVTRHGGRVWFESEEGAGTTFFFSIPASGDRGPQAPAAELMSS